MASVKKEIESTRLATRFAAPFSVCVERDSLGDAQALIESSGGSRPA
jgi:hypothetical protein